MKTVSNKNGSGCRHFRRTMSRGTAWEVVSKVMTDLKSEGADFADHEVARYRAFVSARGQLLNQSPELRNC